MKQRKILFTSFSVLHEIQKNSTTSIKGIKNIFSFKRFISTYGNSLISPSTIYSLSSGTNTKSAVAVIRISGKDSSKVLELLTRKHIPTPRVASLRSIYDPITKEKLDNSLVLWFPSPASYTGEDMVELHTHGGRAVIHDVLVALGKIEGLSSAQPGDFTRRAFQNGKLDLTEVEGLADLINAETEAQRRQALRQMDGELSKLYDSWKADLLISLANFEAVIDFGEDEEISSEVLQKVFPRVHKLLESIQNHLNDGRRGERMRDGVEIIIAGPPNSGKSSLMNLLAKRQASIVSPIPGTTRDIVEVVLNFGGYPVVLGDTAGIRNSNDAIEIEGIKRAKDRVQKADLRIFMFDISEFPKNMDPHLAQLSKNTVIVLNKEDLNTKEIDIKEALEKLQWESNKVHIVSCKTGKGIPEFLKALEHEVSNFFSNYSIEGPTITRARHREHLLNCVSHLEKFLETKNVVIAAEELRLSISSLSKLVGKIGVEEMLDYLFGSFCIGK